jgi:hypothetical protein
MSVTGPGQVWVSQGPRSDQDHDLRSALRGPMKDQAPVLKVCLKRPITVQVPGTGPVLRTKCARRNGA